MNDPERKSVAAATDRRERGRVRTARAARLLPASRQTEVIVENTSEGGLFAVLEGTLEFEIILTGETEPRRVQLVRSQSLPGGKLGIGFKFVPPHGPGGTS